MKHASTTLASMVLALSFAARAEDAPKAHPVTSSGGSSGSSPSPSGGHSNAGHSGGSSVDTGLIFFDIFLNLVALGAEAAAVEQAARVPPPPAQDTLAQRVPADDDDPPGYGRRRRRDVQARQGLLLSFGVGGGSMYLSEPTAGRTGAFDLDFRLGYGFSDRFQLFMDAALDAANYVNGDEIASWTFTIRGQTVLVGDRAGNGLNLNLGVGLGGITRNSGYVDQSSSPSGLALAGGLSYDARVSPWFSLSPEFFVTWHAIPNRRGLPQDVASAYGLRVNFLWYLH